MAHTATGTISNGFSFKAVLNSIVDFAVSIAESNHRIRELQRLSDMSDEQLAKRGLQREDIVHHVFRDVYYI